MKRAILFVLRAMLDRIGGLGVFALILAVGGIVWYVVKAISRFLGTVFVPSIMLLSVAVLAGCHHIDEEAFLCIGGALCALWVLVGIVRVAFRIVFVLAVVAFIAALFSGCDGEPFAVPRPRTSDAAFEDTQTPTTSPTDAGSPETQMPRCGGGPIVILQTCNIPESGEWLCQTSGSDAASSTPCLVPNLHRVIVRSCDQCQGIDLLGGEIGKPY